MILRLELVNLANKVAVGGLKALNIESERLDFGGMRLRLIEKEFAECLLTRFKVGDLARESSIGGEKSIVVREKFSDLQRQKVILIVERVGDASLTLEMAFRHELGANVHMEKKEGRKGAEV